MDYTNIENDLDNVETNVGNDLEIDLDINLDKDEFMKLSLAINKGFGKLEFYNNQIRWYFDLTKEYNKLTKSKEKDFSILIFTFKN